MSFRIFSPATTANIGAGFDCMGICFRKENIFEFSQIEKGIVVNGNTDTKKNQSNMVIRTLYETCGILGFPAPRGVKLDITTRIPLSRGLGSSASCLTAGAVAAYLFAGERPDKRRILTIAGKMEGHPDNIAANLFGGGILAYEKEEGYDYIPFSISNVFVFTALISPDKLPTKQAREILPEKYARPDIVFNIAHAALTMRALTKGDVNLLSFAVGDKIHEPYRRKIIAGYDEVEGIARDAGSIAIFLSGAGPTLIAISRRSEQEAIRKAFAASAWKAVPLNVNKSGLRWKMSEAELGKKRSPPPKTANKP